MHIFFPIVSMLMPSIAASESVAPQLSSEVTTEPLRNTTDSPRNPSQEFLRSSRNALRNLSSGGYGSQVLNTPLHRALYKAMSSNQQVSLHAMPKPDNHVQPPEAGRGSVNMAIGFTDHYGNLTSDITVPKTKGPWAQVIFIPPYRNRCGFLQWMIEADNYQHRVSSSDDDSHYPHLNAPIIDEDNDRKPFLDAFARRIDVAAAFVTAMLTSDLDEDEWAVRARALEVELLHGLFREIKSNEWDGFDADPSLLARSYILPNAEAIVCTTSDGDYKVRKMELIMPIGDGEDRVLIPSLRMLAALVASMRSAAGKAPVASQNHTGPERPPMQPAEESFMLSRLLASSDLTTLRRVERRMAVGLTAASPAVTPEIIARDLPCFFTLSYAHLILTPSASPQSFYYGVSATDRQRLCDLHATNHDPLVWWAKIVLHRLVRGLWCGEAQWRAAVMGRIQKYTGSSVIGALCDALSGSAERTAVIKALFEDWLRISCSVLPSGLGAPAGLDAAAWVEYLKKVKTAIKIQ